VRSKEKFNDAQFSDERFSIKLHRSVKLTAIYCSFSANDVETDSLSLSSYQLVINYFIEFRPPALGSNSNYR
jgi:hypothetical protein